MFVDHKLRAAIRRALGMSALTLASTPFVAAQQAPQTPGRGTQPLEEVVVTGTRIVEPNMQSISPVTEINSEQMQITGQTRVEDILNRLPQVFADQGAAISNAATGTATVNLRGLGSQRTLVLVNGRRLMPGEPDGSSEADLNQIPLLLVKRVDVLTGGASSVYGADAVAGVVNFVMDTDFEGLRVNANYGGYSHSNANDGPAAQANLDAGFPLPPGHVNLGYTRDFDVAYGIAGADERTHATIFATYRQVDPVLQRSFDYSACTLNSGDSFSCGGSLTTAPAAFYPISPSGDFISDAIVDGDYGTTIGPGNVLRPANAGDLYNYGALNYYQRPDERYTAGAFANLGLAEGIEAYGSVMFMDDRSVAQIAPSGTFFGQTITLSCDNPLLSPSMVQEFCTQFAGTSDFEATKSADNPDGTTSMLIGRRNVEGGGRQDHIGHTSYNITAGVRGDITSNWQFDAYFENGATKRDSTYLHDLSKTHIQRALDVVTDPDTGQPVCRSVLDGTDPNCAPWNIFSYQSDVSPEALAYLQQPGIISAEAIQRITHADVTGNLNAKLPSAKTGIAVNFGIEHRTESADYQPDTEFQTGDLAGQGGATLPVTGSFSVSEAFAETRVPLIEDHPIAQVVSLEAGYRYSEYSEGFNTDTYKFGVDWTPVSAIRLRGSIQRAIRAPNVGELFQPQTVLLDGATDPCAGSSPSATMDQCLLTGMTAAQYGNVPENPAGQYNGLLGGNQGLQPEKGDTKSFGVAWTPDFTSLSLSVDYFDINIDNRISDTLGGNADAYIQQCLSTGSPVFCQRIHRDEFGSLWLSPTNAYVIDYSLNTGFLSTKGVDIQANYALDLAGSNRLAFNLVGTRLQELDTELVSGLGAFDCAGYYGNTCGSPSPRWRHSLRTTWQGGWHDVNVALTWRYFDPVNIETTSGNPQLAGDVFATDRRLASQSYLDVAGAMKFGQNYTLRVGINNLLDKDPPLTGSDDCPTGPCNGNTWPQVYEALGRQWFVTMTVDLSKQ